MVQSNRSIVWFLSTIMNYTHTNQMLYSWHCESFSSCCYVGMDGYLPGRGLRGNCHASPWIIADCEVFNWHRLLFGVNYSNYPIVRHDRCLWFYFSLSIRVCIWHGMVSRIHPLEYHSDYAHHEASDGIIKTTFQSTQ